MPLDGDEVRACWEDGAIPLEPDPPIPGLLDLLTERALPVLPSTTAATAGSVVAGAAGWTSAATTSARTDPDDADPFAEERARTGERSVSGALRLRPDRGVVVRREWVELEV
jgi:hypothetical protein